MFVRIKFQADKFSLKKIRAKSAKAILRENKSGLKKNFSAPHLTLPLTSFLSFVIILMYFLIHKLFYGYHSHLILEKF